jgi:hypothetical protein
MNLRSIANSATRSVNPNVVGSVKQSTGYTTGGDGTRTPTYNVVSPVTFQAQPLSAADLLQLDSLNIQGVTRKVYANMQIKGVERPAGTGGDLLVFGGQTWLASAILEPFDASGWCSVGVTQQNGA